MNVGSIQALFGSMPQSNVQGDVSQAVDVAGENVFGLVLAKITEGEKTTETHLQESDADVATDGTISTIFNATTVEELIAELKLGDVSISELQNLQELDGFSQLSDVDISNLVESIIPLLEQAGLSESELVTASSATDLWSLLTVLDENAPKLFTEMLSALEGKGVIPKEQAIELLAFLKAVAIAAPETDLTMRQEQQIFSLQGLLVSTGDRFESTLNSNQKRNNVLQLMDARQIVRFTMQNDTPEESMKDTPKETVQQSVNHMPLTTRTEAAPAEVESRNNARNETLLREMQNIFKRSNFGQTGGTNRLLIKLYPEHLGQVRIELLQTNGIMTARILASSALGKEMLDSQLHQLRSAFLQQNLQVERIDISQMLEDASKNEQQHGMFNQHFQQEQEGTNEQDRQDEEEMTFQEYMIELEA